MSAYWTAQEIANLLGVTKRTVDRWNADFSIPPPSEFTASGMQLWTWENVQRIRDWYMKRVPRTKSQNG